MNRDLKPCPFCGCAMTIRSNRDWHRPEGDHADTCPVYDSDLMYPATDHGMRALLTVWNNQKALAAPASGAALSFEDWARSEGLIQESHGLRFVNLMTDIARKAWQAATAPIAGAALSGDLPSLPAPDTHCYDEDEKRDVWSYSAELVQAYARAAIAHQPPKEALTKTDLCNLIEAYVDASQDHHDSITVDDGRKCRAAMLDAQHALSIAIEAATGPNKALVEALKQVFVNTREKKVRDYIRAALSAAGVTLKGE